MNEREMALLSRHKLSKEQPQPNTRRAARTYQGGGTAQGLLFSHALEVSIYNTTTACREVLVISSQQEDTHISYLIT